MSLESFVKDVNESTGLLKKNTMAAVHQDPSFFIPPPTTAPPPPSITLK